MSAILTDLMVNAICKAFGEQMLAFRGATATVRDLCSSHESLRSTLAAVTRDLALARGAMSADDERLRVAAERAGVTWLGCDTADAMADRIADVTRERDEWESKHAHEEQARKNASLAAMLSQEVIALRESERDTAIARLDRAVKALREWKCSRCNGKGSYRADCTLCGDSTYDHHCNDHDVECSRCGGSGRDPVARAALREVGEAGK